MTVSFVYSGAYKINKGQIGISAGALYSRLSPIGRLKIFTLKVCSENVFKSEMCEYTLLLTVFLLKLIIIKFCLAELFLRITSKSAVAL